MANPEVEIEQGKLVGQSRKTSNDIQFYAFKSIPYAKPPTGDLRFKIPVPPEPWNGILDATKDCNICAQLDRLTGNIVGDEDCLYLNVYTPKLPDTGSSLLPVMVFLHGGGFVYGHGTDDAVHGPDYLIQKDVVVVSLNYRLGILGFLSLERKEAPGNMGLRDQVLALKWVQKNICKFGGDPDNVTIFGVSAGGASVEYLLLSPMSKGLFHKAIAQSGSSLLHWAQQDNIKKLAAMIPALNKKDVTDDEQLYQYLKDLPINDLIKSSILAIAADKFRGGIHFGFVPTIEKSGDWDPFLDQSSFDLLSQGKFIKVPFISGFCSREGLLMLGIGLPILEKLLKDKDFITHLPFELNNIQREEISTSLKSVYSTVDTEEPDSFGIDFFTDVDFLAGIYVATTLIAKNNSPVYFYEFSYDGSQNYLKNKYNIMNRKGACHGDDGGYLIKTNILPENLSETDKLVRDRIVTMWTNFAKYSDPTPMLDNLITTKWEPVAEASMACLQIDDKLTMKYDIYPERMKIFEELYMKHYK